MHNRAALTLVLAVFIVPTLAAAADHCPPAVKAAAQKAYPNAKITSCKREAYQGKTQYEAKISIGKTRSVEMDLSPDGSVLLTEETVGLDLVPASVTSAFEGRYPGTKATRAEKQVTAAGSVSYELAFSDSKGAHHEATFKEDGTFVEQE